MVRTIQPLVEGVMASEVFERIQPLSLNFRDPKGMLTIPTNYTSQDAMDQDITRVVDGIKSVREDFTSMAAKGFVDGEYVATALSAAELVVDGMVHHVQRHYDQRQEGLRTCREREYAKIGKTGYRNLLKRAFATVSNAIDTKAAVMKKERNKRMDILHDALEKLHMHSHLMHLTDGGREPHWNWSLA
ncbi:hypothetical protein FGRMN_3598 [Fusarium graminum]|nr:hypothetical protein FGRMN_3598 [Fusarium graminum]